MKRTIPTAAVLLLATAGSLAAQDAAAGQAAFAPCVACHGADGGGNKTLNAPAIAGQEAWYVARQLKNFKNGIRGGANDMIGMTMAPNAQMLATDADIDNIAAYVASMSPAAVTDDGGGDAAAGEALFAVCVACHGADGKGMETMNAPNLTLQQDWYVVRQLANFNGGVRGAHAQDTFGAQMVPMAATVADETAAKNVAAYIATLR